MSNLANIGTNDRRNTYSAIINGGTMTGKASMSSVQRKILASKNRLGQIDDEFKVSNDKFADNNTSNQMTILL